MAINICSIILTFDVGPSLAPERPTIITNKRFISPQAHILMNPFSAQLSMKKTTKIETVGSVSLDRCRNPKKSLAKLSYFEMDSTTILASLPEESLEQELEQRQHSHSQQQQQEDSHKTKPLPSSAFASVPDRPPTQSSSEKYSALDWMGYFDKEWDVSIVDADDVFHVYMAGTEGPVVFCLHGGGYSGL